MRALRILLGLVLIAAGGLTATILGYQMLITAAYAAWGLAFVYCMATALASIIVCIGGYVTAGMLPGFMRYTPPPSRVSGPPAAPAPPSRDS